MSESIVLERLLSSPERDQTATPNLKRQRVYILPTRPGFLLCVALLTMLLGAINYNNSMAYILVFLLGSVYMVCMLHTYRNLAGLIIKSAVPNPVFAGEMAAFPLIIDNRNGQMRSALRLVLHPSRSKNKRLDHNHNEPVMINLQANQWQHVEIPVFASKRGLLSLERVMISSCFPLGLFRAWSYINLREKCVVYPKPEGIDQFPAPVTAQEQGLDGDNSGTSDFAGFRQYHPGDSIRNIAWKVVAREQPLLVKRFSGEGSHTLMLTWDDVIHLQDVELGLSQLCRWILLAENQGWNYGLEIPGFRTEPSQGTLHKNQCLEALSRFGGKHAD
jgi:uncharacterized protein (DUF58 family)